MTVSKTQWRLALLRPGRAFEIASAMLKGRLFVAWYRLRGRRITAGAQFRIHGRLVLQGNGEVVIGNHVIFYGRVTPFTHNAQARIEIGDNCVLDGVRMGCATAITIRKDCLLAECHIMDTDFHSTRADRRSNDKAPVRTLPVTIDENVWICAGAGLLPGTHIGRNSVVGLGAICVRRYPDNVILFGNPAQVVAPVGAGDGTTGYNPPA